MIGWADVIFVMEPKHERELLQRCADVAARKPVVGLDLPAQFDYLSPELIEPLTTKLTPCLGIPREP